MPLAEPRVVGTGTAVPPHTLGQDAAKEVARGLFAGRTDRAIDRLLPVFDHVRVDRRFLCQPVEWYLDPHPFSERNAVYRRWAIELGAEAAVVAMAAAAVSPEDIGSIVFVSTTGLATPSLDVALMRHLDLAPHSHRQAMFGRGCAGGVAGLAQATDRARLDPGRVVLLVVVELCSLTYRRADLATSNIVSSALFGDGAAAVVVVVSEADRARRSPAVIGHDTVTWPDTEELMGWDFGDDGMSVVLSKSIPALVRQELRASVEAACRRAEVNPADIRHHLVHPGSAVVLDAVTEALGLPRDALDRSRAILREYGNMSAATILFILDRFLTDGAAAAETVAVSALGPGFSADHLFLRW